MSPETDSRNRVLEFARRHANSWLELDLLCFWGNYPYARFTVGIIARALGSERRADVQQALDALVRGRLIEKRVDRGQPFYSLTRDPGSRECVLQMPTYKGSLRPAASMA